MLVRTWSLPLLLPRALLLRYRIAFTEQLLDIHADILAPDIRHNAELGTDDYRCCIKEALCCAYNNHYDVGRAGIGVDPTLGGNIE